MGVVKADAAVQRGEKRALLTARPKSSCVEEFTIKQHQFRCFALILCTALLTLGASHVACI